MKQLLGLLLIGLTSVGFAQVRAEQFDTGTKVSAASFSTLDALVSKWEAKSQSASQQASNPQLRGDEFNRLLGESATYDECAKDLRQALATISDSPDQGDETGMPPPGSPPGSGFFVSQQVVEQNFGSLPPQPQKHVYPNPYPNPQPILQPIQKQAPLDCSSGSNTLAYRGVPGLRRLRINGGNGVFGGRGIPVLRRFRGSNGC